VMFARKRVVCTACVRVCLHLVCSAERAWCNNYIAQPTKLTGAAYIMQNVCCMMRSSYTIACTLKRSPQHAHDAIRLSSTRVTAPSLASPFLRAPRTLLHDCRSAPYITMVRCGALAPMSAVVWYTKLVHVTPRSTSPECA
jgi:hypothetical protein